jgi:DNA-binding MarR family transcriptional regulator
MNKTARKPATKATDTFGESGMLGLLEAARVLHERLDQALESVGLSSPKYMALEELTRAGGAMSLSALADCRKCVRSNITQLIDRLEADGLVKRSDDPQDRRAVHAQITKLGAAKFDAGTEAIRKVQMEVAAQVPRDEQASFLRALSAFKKL